jgi:hypothetical protein
VVELEVESGNIEIREIKFAKIRQFCKSFEGVIAFSFLGVVAKET